jgi:hypothetical protein
MKLGWQILVTLLLGACLSIIGDPDMLNYPDIVGRIGTIADAAIGDSIIAFVAGMVAYLWRVFVVKKSGGYVYLWVSTLAMVLPWSCNYFASYY